MSEFDGGFISLWRKINEWEWYEDDSVFKIYIGLICLANYKDGQWKGIPIKRGSFVTSTEKLCNYFRKNKNTVLRCLKCLSDTGEIRNEVVPNKYRVITIVNYDKYQSVVQNLNNTRDNQKGNRKGNDRNNSQNKNRDTTNKEIRCVCHKGTHTPEKGKISALPSVTPSGDAPTGEHSEILNMSDASGEASMATKREGVMSAGARPQANSAQHYQEQDSSPHRSSDVNPTVMSAGTRPQADDKGETPAVTKDLTQREWRVYCELKGHNEFEAADFWIKQKGIFDEIQKRKVRGFLKAHGERTEGG